MRLPDPSERTGFISATESALSQGGRIKTRLRVGLWVADVYSVLVGAGSPFIGLPPISCTHGQAWSGWASN